MTDGIILLLSISGATLYIFAFVTISERRRRAAMTPEARAREDAEDDNWRNRGL